MYEMFEWVSGIAGIAGIAGSSDWLGGVVFTLAGELLLNGSVSTGVCSSRGWWQGYWIYYHLIGFTASIQNT